MISDFIQALKDQKREEYGRSAYAIYCLSMVEFRESGIKRGNIDEKQDLFKKSAKRTFQSVWGIKGYQRYFTKIF